jgi:hypothetical protein
MLVIKRRYLFPDPDTSGGTPSGDDPKGDDTKGDDTKGDDTKGDDPKGDDPKGDDPKGDDPKGDDPKGDDPKGDADDFEDGEIDSVGAPSFYKPNKDKDKGGDPEPSEALKAEIDRLKKIESEYNTMKANPVVMASINYAASGSTDVNNFIKELSGGYADISKMSMSEIYEANYRNTYAKKYNLDESEIIAAVADFKDLPARKQVEIVDPIRDRMESESQEKIKELAKKIGSETAEDEEKRQKFLDREKEAGANFIKKVTDSVGKQVFRVQVTEEMAKEITAASAKFSVRDPETLEPDLDATMNVWMWLLYGDKILKQHVRYGQNRGLEKGILGKSGRDQGSPKGNNNSSGGSTDKYKATLEKSGGRLPRVGSPTPN